MPTYRNSQMSLEGSLDSWPWRHQAVKLALLVFGMQAVSACTVATPTT